MNLQTKRLIIRNMRETDLEDFVQYRSNPEICKFQGYEPFTREKGREFIEEQINQKFGEAGKWMQFSVVLKRENKLVGDIGLKPESYDSRIVEFGITLSNLHQKQGFGREALTGAFNFLFDVKKAHRIIGNVDTENSDSIRLLENLGFRCEGEFKQSFWNNKMWRDEYLYAMLENDWKINLK